MSRHRRRAPSSSTHRYPRTVRLNELLREVIADELTLIDDDRLDLVTVTAVDVDAELSRAIVYFDSLHGQAGDPAILEALGSHRVRIQSSINRQIHARKTPVLEFRPDEVIRSAERIEEILRQQPVRADETPSGGQTAPTDPS